MTARDGEEGMKIQRSFSGRCHRLGHSLSWSDYGITAGQEEVRLVKEKEGVE